MSRASYITGFLLSLVLTLVAFSLVWRHTQATDAIFSTATLMIIIAVLAVTQLIVQLIFFLHLSRESKPRWNLTVMSFAVLIVAILVFGSLWIMQNLNYQHVDRSSPSDTERYIIQDEGID